MSLEMTISILLVIGIAFMVLEAVTPAFGLLGLGGAFSFFAALMMLRNVDVFYGIPVDAPLLGALGIIGLIVLAGSFYFVRLAWKLRTSAGSEIMIGMHGRVLEWQNGKGRVHLDGETWAAQGPDNLSAGDQVSVTARNQLVLTVTKD